MKSKAYPRGHHLKQTPSTETDWRNFGKQFQGCAIGELAVNSVLNSMTAVEKFMVSPEYQEGLKQYIHDIEKDFVWH
jgi:hypothetical protein